jgi:hypothetical protein
MYWHSVLASALTRTGSTGAVVASVPVTDRGPTTAGAPSGFAGAWTGSADLVDAHSGRAVGVDQSARIGRAVGVDQGTRIDRDVRTDGVRAGGVRAADVNIQPAGVERWLPSDVAPVAKAVAPVAARAVLVGVRPSATGPRAPPQPVI